MKYCTNCGSALNEGTVFCPNCGAKVADPTRQNNAQQNPAQQNAPQQQNPAPQQNPYYNQQNNAQYQQYQQNQYYQQQAQFAQTGGYIPPQKPIHFGQRNIAVAIILSLVTCGIYGLYWMYKIVEELNEASENNGTSGGMVILLSIVTCGIYMFYWMYKAGGYVNTAKTRRNIPSDSNSGIIYLVLCIFGLSIVSYCLIQNELNQIAAYHGAPKA